MSIYEKLAKIQNELKHPNLNGTSLQSTITEPQKTSCKLLNRLQRKVAVWW